MNLIEDTGVIFSFLQRQGKTGNSIKTIKPCLLNDKKQGY